MIKNTVWYIIFRIFVKFTLQNRCFICRKRQETDSYSIYYDTWVTLGWHFIYQVSLSFMLDNQEDSMQIVTLWHFFADFQTFFLLLQCNLYAFTWWSLCFCTVNSLTLPCGSIEIAPWILCFSLVCQSDDTSLIYVSKLIGKICASSALDNSQVGFTTLLYIRHWICLTNQYRSAFVRFF